MEIYSIEVQILRRQIAYLYEIMRYRKIIIRSVISPTINGINEYVVIAKRTLLVQRIIDGSIITVRTRSSLRIVQYRDSFIFQVYFPIDNLHEIVYTRITCIHELYTGNLRLTVDNRCKYSVHSIIVIIVTRISS